PSLQHLQLVILQTPLVLEFALARFGFPRRHDPPRGDGRDLRGTRFHIVIRQQTERSDFAGTVAGGAAMPHDRRNVFVEGERRLRGAHRWNEQQDNDRSPPRRTRRTQRKNLVRVYSSVSPVSSVVESLEF